MKLLGLLDLPWDGGAKRDGGGDASREEPPASAFFSPPPSPIPMMDKPILRRTTWDRALELLEGGAGTPRLDDRHWNKDEIDGVMPKESWFARTETTCDTHMLSMSDGVDIAVDVLRPEGSAAGASLPCILHQTRYYRQWRLRKPLRALESFPMDPINLSFKKAFVSSGFAVVTIDVRGTGASFGQWEAPCQTKEREDSREILDWMVRQKWCNGSVFLYGISYDGMAATFTSSLAHPAVKACASLFSYWDVYSDLGAPGGLLLHYFFDNWNQLNHALDSGKLIDAPSPIGASFVAGFKGVKGVSKGLVKKALNSHKTADLGKCLRQVNCRDDRPEALGGKKMDDCSPYTKSREIRESKTPFFLVGGWLDGSARSCINAFCHAVGGSKGSRLLIGPWTHGGVQNAALGPRQKSDYSCFHKVMKLGRSKLVAEVIKFYLSLDPKGNENGEEEEEPITYFTMNAPQGMQKWRRARAWPPAYLEDSILYIGADTAEADPSLQLSPGKAKSEVRIQAASARAETNGKPKRRGNSRYHTMIFVGDLLNYSMQKYDHTFTDSKPLDCHLEVTGTPYLDLWISSTTSDADIIVYLVGPFPRCSSAGRAPKLTPSSSLSSERAGEFRPENRQRQLRHRGRLQSAAQEDLRLDGA